MQESYLKTLIYLQDQNKKENILANPLFEKYMDFHYFDASKFSDEHDYDNSTIFWHLDEVSDENNELLLQKYEDQVQEVETLQFFLKASLILNYTNSNQTSQQRIYFSYINGVIDTESSLVYFTGIPPSENDIQQYFNESDQSYLISDKGNIITDKDGDKILFQYFSNDYKNKSTNYQKSQIFILKDLHLYLPGNQLEEVNEEQQFILIQSSNDQKKLLFVVMELKNEQFMQNLHHHYEQGAQFNFLNARYVIIRDSEKDNYVTLVQNSGDGYYDQDFLKQLENIFGQQNVNDYKQFKSLLDTSFKLKDGKIINFQLNQNGQKTINIIVEPFLISGYFQFAYVFIYDLDLSQENFNVIYQQLLYIKYTTFGVLLITFLFFMFVVIRYTIKTSNYFEYPLIFLINFIHDQGEELNVQHDQNHMNHRAEQDFLENNISCYETQQLYQIIIKIINNIKLTHKVFQGSESVALIELSSGKLFFQNYKDQQGIGICCNNIGNIHLMQGRYYEAVAEYQQSILMAKLNYENIRLLIKQLKKRQMKKKLERLASPIKTLISSVYNKISFPEQQKKEDNLKSKFYKNMLHKKVKSFTSETSSNELILNLYNLPYQEMIDQLNEQLNISQVCILNRKFQLGNALLEYSQQQSNEIFYSQALRLFDQCHQIYQDQKSENHHFNGELQINALLESENKTNLVKQILIEIKKSLCLLKTGEYSQAEESLKNAQTFFDCNATDQYFEKWGEI